MIQPHPSAPDGSVTSLPDYTPASFSPTDAILCRNVAPTIAFAFGCIQRHIGVRVLGRDIGAGLVTLIDGCKTDSLDELCAKLDTKQKREYARAIRDGNLSAAAAVEDKYECLKLFTANADSVRALRQSIFDLFDETKRGLLTLATIHKSKGLEWDRVFRLDFHKLLPSRWATLPWQLQQERNLQYVCSTRARIALVDIHSDCWKEPADNAASPVLFDEAF